MGILNTIQIYGNKKYKVVDTVKFSEEELAEIVDNVVVASDFGKTSCCLFLKGGRTAYIVLSKYAKSNIGDKLNLREAEVDILENEEGQIMRIRG